jgi:hypothetical protein
MLLLSQSQQYHLLLTGGNSHLLLLLLLWTATLVQMCGQHRSKNLVTKGLLQNWCGVKGGNLIPGLPHRHPNTKHWSWG